jgi:hypothetical protein
MKIRDAQTRRNFQRPHEKYLRARLLLQSEYEKLKKILWPPSGTCAGDSGSFWEVIRDLMKISLRPDHDNSCFLSKGIGFYGYSLTTEI